MPYVSTRGLDQAPVPLGASCTAQGRLFEGAGQRLSPAQAMGIASGELQPAVERAHKPIATARPKRPKELGLRLILS